MVRETDIACDLDVFSVDERGDHIQSMDSWRAAITARHELPNGYRFELERDEGLLETLARFIALESRCCPFFSFALEVPSQGALALSITGPDGAKAILADAR
jgi:hypothetical protein